MGLTLGLAQWYQGRLRWEARWLARHHYLLRKRWLETKQDLEERQDAAQARAYVPPAPTYVAPTPEVTTTTQPYVAPSAPSTYGYVDPSSLPYPWSCVVAVESHGYNVWNSGGSGASGYFQFMPSTWQGLGYSGDAIDYPFSTQYAGAQSLYAQQGLGPWAGDGC